jgi:hypothetical protein
VLLTLPHSNHHHKFSERRGPSIHGSLSRVYTHRRSGTKEETPKTQGGERLEKDMMREVLSAVMAMALVANLSSAEPALQGDSKSAKTRVLAIPREARLKTERSLSPI